MARAPHLRQAALGRSVADLVAQDRLRGGGANFAERTVALGDAVFTLQSRADLDAWLAQATAQE